MGGLAERLHPADLPAVLEGPDARWWSALFGVLVLVAIGLVMTALMQSSTAAVAVTLSAYYAGAIGLDQGFALIIGQNIGTATSSALAAIGASATAKRLAIAYVLFKLIAALIALVLFPVSTPLLLRATSMVDGVALLAAYHTAYNVVGVVVLLPLIDRFTRLVERILPERGSPLTRCLDSSALATPIVAVEAVRRTIARALATVCCSIEAALAGHAEPIRLGKDAVSVQEAADALLQAQVFLSDVSGPPDTDDQQRRLTSTLHALDHASRLTEAAREGSNFGSVKNGPDDIRAGELCAEVMRTAAAIARGVATPPHAAGSPQVVPAARGADAMAGPRAIPPDEAIAELERCTKQLGEMLRIHRGATLGAVANGTLTADAALLRVETLRSLEALSQLGALQFILLVAASRSGLTPGPTTRQRTNNLNRLQAVI
jgi:phosphate:Na+ symporter